VGEREVEVPGRQRNVALEEGGAEGREVAGGDEVRVELEEVRDGAGRGDESTDGGRGRGHALPLSCSTLALRFKRCDRDCWSWAGPT
jgi:hypothetical protein